VGSILQSLDAQPASSSGADAGHLGKADRTTANPVAGRIYRPQLDVLRFFAFFSVFLHHALNTQTSGALMHNRVLSAVIPFFVLMCGLGLPLFFFLSSFLITALLQAERQKTGTIHLPSFYLRRGLRIWPLYFVFILAVFVLGHFWTRVAIEPARLAAFFLIAGNWYCLYVGMGTAASSQLWSISVEEQFYLIWPALLRALTTGGQKIACWAVLGIALLVAALQTAHNPWLLPVWLNSFVEMAFFAGGGLLALHIGLRPQPARPFLGAAVIAAGVLLCALAIAVAPLSLGMGTAGPLRTPLAYALVTTGCGCFIWGVLALPERSMPKPLIYLGRISYGLYIFHAIVLVSCEHWIGHHTRIPGLVMVVELAVTISIAAASYRFLERPFLKLKSRFEFVKTRAA
jgi:peptidoglycan/LPS O-acetylase OafA/YrhL